MKRFRRKGFLAGSAVLFILLAAAVGDIPVPADTNGWVSTVKGLAYIDPATGKTAVGLVEIDSEFYYFDEVSGIMLTGFVNTPDGAAYYFDESGKMLRGWRNIGKDRYYFLQSDGSMVKGNFVTWNENRYYLGTDGKMMTGLCTVDGETYYFADSGEMLKGWRNIDGARYYFLQDDGTMVKNHFVTWKDDRYYLGTDGNMTKGFCSLDGKTYYFSENGAMLKGWRNIGDARYYFLQDDGSMVQNHFVTWKDKKFYLGPDGKMVTGFYKLNDKVYYFSEKGDMLYGWRNIDGNRYYFLQSDGTMVKDHTVTWNDYTYYMGEDGRLVTDRADFELNGEHYRIDSEGRMLSEGDGILYLCGNNGALSRMIGVHENGLLNLPTLDNPENGTFIGWATEPGLKLNLITPTQVAFEPGDTVHVTGTARIYSAVFMNDQDIDIEEEEFAGLSEELGAVVFVGDARFRSMDSASGQYRSSLSNVSFITDEYANLDWLISEGYGSLVTKINNIREKTDKPAAVVFQIGLSDLEAGESFCDRYVSALSQIADALKEKNCRMFFMSLLPINPRQMELTDTRIPGEEDPLVLRDFNTRMEESLPDEYVYLDLYSWLMAYGYRSDDGFHFSDATSRRILDETIKRVNREAQ